MKLCSYQSCRGRLLAPHRRKESNVENSSRKLSDSLVRAIRYNYLQK